MEPDLIDLIDENARIVRGTLAPVEGATLRDLQGPVGFAEEAAEVLGVIKKYAFHGHPFNRDKLVEELGDAWYYFHATCIHYGIDVEEVVANNNKKVSVRYPQGFSTEASIARVDVKNG